MPVTQGLLLFGLFWVALEAFIVFLTRPTATTPHSSICMSKCEGKKKGWRPKLVLPSQRVPDYAYAMCAAIVLHCVMFVWTNYANRMKIYTSGKKHFGLVNVFSLSFTVSPKKKKCDFLDIFRFGFLHRPDNSFKHAHVFIT